ncbi:MAG: tetratricopeptide repeat protein [Rhodospirillales bacterium]|nr:tetratricopeptide repeat protein [Rhodospirillales bacterium]
MREGFLRGSRYSPGNMDRESLEALFVGRQDVMEDVLSRITRSVQSPEKHYILLVGPRGAGKTHLLALAYHRLLERLRADDAGDHVVIAVLNEEEWGVASYLDLVVRILRAMADQAPDLEADIAKIYDRFSKDPAEAEALALGLLRQCTRGKTLLLLCENLVDLFDGLDDEGQKRWRATIQEDGNWAIVASTPSLFATLSLQDHPFYGFFTVRALEKIDFETGLEVLARKALHDGKAELAAFLRTPVGRARARAVHHLAAGNYRAYVVLSDFLDQESLEDLVGPFMQMVDDLTPYYQDRMRQLPPAQRKIVEYLCLEGVPTAIKDIATPCLMSHQTAAKQIGGLEAAGFVSRMRSGRNTFCELSEPLMRICIEVKDNKTQHFRLFVEFLRHWFSTRELVRRQDAFRRHGPGIDLDRLHVEEAVRCSLADCYDPFVNALDDEARRCLEAGDSQGLAAIQESLVRDRGAATDYVLWVSALLEQQGTQSAIAAGRQAIAAHPDDALVHFALACTYRLEEQFAEALLAVDQALTLKDDPAFTCLRADVLRGLDRFEESIEEAQAVLDRDPDHWRGLDQMIQTLARLGRLEEAETHANELVQLAPGEPIALLKASNFFRARNRLDQALELVNKALDIDDGILEARHLRGLILFDMEDYDRAVADLRQAVSQVPNAVFAHRRLADSLLLSGRWEEAIEVADRLIEIDPDHRHPYVVRGEALLRLGRPAAEAFDQLLRFDDHKVLLAAASQVRATGDLTSAKRYLARVAELVPDDLDLWVERTRLQIDEGNLEAAAESASGIEALPGRALLGRLLRAQAVAAREPLDVALGELGTTLVPEEFETDERLHLDATVAILSESVRNFGPQHLPQGLAKLQYLSPRWTDRSLVGPVLTGFLKEYVAHGFGGSLDDWESALQEAADVLVDVPDCRIPVAMLQAATRYTKTGDEKHLLSVPLEQRQLLEERLQPRSENPPREPGNLA